jgi:hypothetical protein
MEGNLPHIMFSRLVTVRNQHNLFIQGVFELAFFGTVYFSELCVTSVNQHSLWFETRIFYKDKYIKIF